MAAIVPLSVFSNTVNADKQMTDELTNEERTASEKLPPPTEAVPVPNIEDARMGQLAEAALSYPKLKEWSTEWEVGTIGYRGTVGNSISYDYAIFYLRLPEEAEAPYQCSGGWEAVIEVNMQTLEANELYIPSESNHTCAVPITTARS